MSVYNFGAIPSRFEESPNDDGFLPNPVPGTEYPDQSWSQEGSIAIYPINIDYQNGWVSSIFVDGGNTSQNRDARLCVQTASFNQRTGSFEQGRSEKFADIPTFTDGSTERHPWQPYTNVWSFRNRKLKQTVVPGQCAFVMPSDDGNVTSGSALDNMRADHLWLYLINCDDGVISYTRHLIWSATESISGVDPSADLAKNNIEWDLQVIDGAVIVYWSLTDVNLDNKAWLFSRVFDLDTQTVGTTNIVLEGTSPTPGALLYRVAWSVKAGDYAVLQIIIRGDWAPVLVVIDSLGAFVSSLSLVAEVMSYGSTSFTFPLSGMGLVEIDDTRAVSVVTIDHEDGRGVVVIDVAHDTGTLTIESSLVIVDPTKTILSGEPTGIGAEPLPDGRVSVFTYEWDTYDLPVLHFFVVDQSVSSWHQDGEFHMSWDSDFAGGLGVGPAWGQHINKWWTYLGRERLDEDGVLSNVHGFPLGYYSVSFGMIPSLRLAQRDDDNELGAARVEQIQKTSGQKSTRVGGPNLYW